MKEIIAIILAAVMLLSLSACGDERNQLSTATTTEATEVITQSTEATEPATEPTEVTEAADDTVVCNFDDLHPLYRQTGYPDLDVKLWISADEVEPTLDADCPYDEWLKCVYVGNFTTGGETREINVFHYVCDGVIGTWIVNDRGDKMNAYGFSFKKANEDRNIRLQSNRCDAEQCCGVWVYPEKDHFMIVAYECKNEVDPTTVDWIDSQSYFDGMEEIPATIKAECPYEGAKCVYTGTFIDYDDGLEVELELNVYLYVADGLIGTWMTTDRGHELHIYGNAFGKAVNGRNVATFATTDTENGGFWFYPETYGFMLVG